MSVKNQRRHGPALAQKSLNHLVHRLGRRLIGAKSDIAPVRFMQPSRINLAAIRFINAQQKFSPAVGLGFAMGGDWGRPALVLPQLPPY